MKVPEFDITSAILFNSTRDTGFDFTSPRAGEWLAKMVALFQAENGLVVDGKLGPATMRALAEAVSINVDSAPYFVPAGARARGIERARKASDELCFYLLGAGGSKRSPFWPTWPWNENRQADCSAFVCWALEFARNDGDWNTTKVLRDALRKDGGRGPETRFRVRRSPKDVLPGDILVKDGIFDPKTGLRTKPGHIGMLLEIDPAFDWENPEWWKLAKVAHCSPSNSAPPPKGRGTGHAIGITDAKAWRVAGDLDFDGDIDAADNHLWWASNDVAFVTYIPFG